MHAYIHTYMHTYMYKGHSGASFGETNKTKKKYVGHSGASYGETNKASGGELWGLAAHPSKESFVTVGDDAMLFLWDFLLEGKDSLGTP